VSLPEGSPCRRRWRRVAGRGRPGGGRPGRWRTVAGRGRSDGGRSGRCMSVAGAGTVERRSSSSVEERGSGGDGRAAVDLAGVGAWQGQGRSGGTRSGRAALNLAGRCSIWLGGNRSGRWRRWVRDIGDGAGAWVVQQADDGGRGDACRVCGGCGGVRGAGGGHGPEHGGASAGSFPTPAPLW
jgi:hypothetical protein